MPAVDSFGSQLTPLKETQKVLNYTAVDAELADVHQSAKSLVRALSQGQSKKMSKSSFENSTDTKAAASKGMVKYNPRTNVVSLTRKANSLLNR